MDNSTNRTDISGEHTPFGYYSLFITLFFLTPVFIFNVLLIVIIIVEKALPATIRLILVNILASSELVILGIAVILLASVILSGVDHLQPSEFICRLSLFAVASGAAGSLLYMATFAGTVYFLVLEGVAKVGFLRTLIVVVSIWVFATVPNLVLFLPEFLTVTFLDNEDCAAHGQGATSIVYAFTYIAVYGICSFVISITFPILTVHFIMTNTITENAQMLKSMMKFAVCLFIGATMNLMGISIPLLFATFAPTGDEYYTLVKAFNYTEGTLLMLSLIPTPIIILIFFEPIRNKFKMIFCLLPIKSEKDGGPQQK